ncbi:hypothetical protein ADL03_06815 [Nocardia sp. NRRL S-836]|nr:hypothetical protein ADL03_06815 [Nocardia sp. NRRL S-836]
MFGLADASCYVAATSPVQISSEETIVAGRDADNSEFGWARVRRTSVTGLIETIMDRRSRTKWARMQGKAITGVTRVLVRSSAIGEVAVVQGDGSHWTVTITPNPAAVGTLTEASGA